MSVDRCIKGAEIILRDCLNIRENEVVSIISDPERGVISRALGIVGREMGANTIILENYYNFKREVDALGSLNYVVENSDVIIFVVSDIKILNFGHSKLRKDAVKRGARVGFITTDIDDIDPARLEASTNNTNKLADLLDKAKKAKVWGKGGTELELDIDDRTALRLTNNLREKGKWGAIPEYMEATISVVEGTANGLIYIDGVIAGIGLPEEPIKVEVQQGKIVKVHGNSIKAESLSKFLKEADSNAYNIAELGIGSVPYEHWNMTGTFEDKKILGTIHFGIGDNSTIGGNTKSSIHIDLQVMEATVELDGNIIIKDGKLVY